MTASDSMLNAIQLHEILDKEEVTVDELNRAHELVSKQQKTIEKVWFTILAIDNSIASHKEKLGDKDALLTVLRVTRDEFLKAIGEPNYFKS